MSDPQENGTEVLLTGKRADGVKLEVTREVLCVGPARYAIGELGTLSVKQVGKVSTRGFATMVIATLVTLPAIFFQFTILLIIGLCILAVALTKFGKVEAWQLIGNVDGAPAVVLEASDRAMIEQVKAAVEGVGE